GRRDRRRERRGRRSRFLVEIASSIINGSPTGRSARQPSEVPMTPTGSDQSSPKNGTPGGGSVADEVKRGSERLRQLAEELKAHEQDQAEMRANYAHLKQAVYALLREKFERESPPLPDKNLEAVAADEGALPLEAFIGQIEPPAARQG